MNTKFKIDYLSGGDDVFGPNYGGATVYTNERAGFAQGLPEPRQAASTTSSSPCPWRTRSWARSCSTSEEPDKAATDWLKANPAVLDAWLAGVTTFDGQPGLPAVKKSLGL